jgi:hypothetical protein
MGWNSWIVSSGEQSGERFKGFEEDAWKVLKVQFRNVASNLGPGVWGFWLVDFLNKIFVLFG